MDSTGSGALRIKNGLDRVGLTKKTATNLSSSQIVLNKTQFEPNFGSGPKGKNLDQVGSVWPQAIVKNSGQIRVWVGQVRLATLPGMNILSEKLEYNIRNYLTLF